jgi:hypothetical protein
VSQRLKSYFGASPELRQLSSKAGQLLALQRHYEQIAPASLMRYSRVLQLEQQILILAANNGAIAAKLRQLAPELIKMLQNKGYEVTGIQVRVQVTLPAAEYTPAPPTLSATGRKRLVDLAADLPDSPLKSALQRLANKTGGKPEAK